mmetsp:Transcript_8510/g.20542  ORF Transcript_8510/g.20542 Transcript_8510/m.20542 type:complete len:233 (+) Transcript_8510:1323-2021(+)
MPSLVCQELSCLAEFSLQPGLRLVREFPDFLVCGVRGLRNVGHQQLKLVVGSCCYCRSRCLRAFLRLREFSHALLHVLVQRHGRVVRPRRVRNRVCYHTLQLLRIVHQIVRFRLRLRGLCRIPKLVQLFVHLLRHLLDELFLHFLLRGVAHFFRRLVVRLAGVAGKERSGGRAAVVYRHAARIEGSTPRVGVSTALKTSRRRCKTTASGLDAGPRPDARVSEKITGRVQVGT